MFCNNFSGTARVVVSSIVLLPAALIAGPGLLGLGVAPWGLSAQAAIASADPPGVQDPHQPDMTKGYCPGGRFGFGKLGVCDGERYSDGSYWHQWMTRHISGPQFYYDCVGGDEPLPGPPPPGGCAGNIPRDQPPPPDAPAPATP